MLLLSTLTTLSTTTTTTTKTINTYILSTYCFIIKVLIEQPKGECQSKHQRNKETNQRINISLTLIEAHTL